MLARHYRDIKEKEKKKITTSSVNMITMSGGKDSQDSVRRSKDKIKKQTDILIFQ